MTHVIEYHTLDRNADRNQFIADMDEVVQAEDYLEGGYYDGSQLTWHDDTVYDTREDAEQAIKGFIRCDYDDHAVLFHDTDDLKLKPTKARQAMEERLNRLILEREQYIAAHHVNARASEFIGCTHCGSRISRKYLRSDDCPVCGHELRPKSTLDRIASFDKRIRSLSPRLRKDEQAAKRKASDKAPVRWLVKTEYHC